ncbi:MAG: cyclic nucleotide-binding domain-containing protein [Chloroflexi bacterium]|nr:cyclic nucleotide-binding domain-containing protein [Chloroflexota bacterium]
MKKPASFARQVIVVVLINRQPVLIFYPGEHLFRDGDLGDYLFLVREGTVKISYFTKDGQEHGLNIFSDGNVFGELFLSQRRHRIGYAKALDRVIACRLTEEDFLALIQQFP